MHVPTEQRGNTDEAGLLVQVGHDYIDSEQLQQMTPAQNWCAPLWQCHDWFSPQMLYTTEGILYAFITYVSGHPLQDKGQSQH